MLALALAVGTLVIPAPVAFAATALLQTNNPVIAADLQEALRTTTDNQLLDVLVYVQDQQPEPAVSVADGDSVTGSLQERALTSQQTIIDQLAQLNQGQAELVESFFLVNMLHLKATAPALLQIALWPAVAKIEFNNTIRQELPQPEKRSKRSRRALDASDGIEPGVTTLGAPKVWEELGITGQGVTVGVLDGGTNYQHPALAEKFVGNQPGHQAQDAYFDAVVPGNGPETGSDFDHGTHVAGTILGQDGAENRIGVAPGAKFIAARGLAADAGEEADLLRATQWFLTYNQRVTNPEDKVRVINNSWGGDKLTSTWFEQAAKNLKAAGIVEVFAAGNTNGYPADGSIANPATLPDVLAVGATTVQGDLAEFSLVGPSRIDPTKTKPDVSAPGVGVRSALAGGGYAALSGTSMAAPHVTGTIALMLSANPELTTDQISQILSETADPRTNLRYPTAPNSGYGAGIINAYEAVKRAQALGNGQLQDQRVTLTGEVVIPGSDETAPKVTPQIPKVAYLGSDLSLAAEVVDDVAVNQVIAKLSINGGHEQDVPLLLTSGDEKAGTYRGTIPATMLGTQPGTMTISITATDYHNQHVTTSTTQTVKIQSGIVPGQYQNDFETELDGWQLLGLTEDGQQIAGDFNIGTPSNTKEPRAAGGSGVLGTKIGANAATRYIDSFAVLPPVDLSAAGANPTLTMQEFLGFNGVSNARVQLHVGQPDSYTSDVGWIDLEEKLIPPTYTPSWVTARYHLGQWAGSSDLIYIRFLFHYPDHGEGPGWYLDNLVLAADDNSTPTPIGGLEVRQRAHGVFLTFTPTGDNDLDHYEVLRKNQGTAETAYQTIGTIDRLGYLQFYDDQVTANHSYNYTVVAVNTAGRKSPIRHTASLHLAEVTGTLLTGDSDAEFTRDQAAGSSNDWERGVPKNIGTPEDVFALRNAQLGLAPKIDTNNNVWATNLGRPSSSSYTGYNAQISGGMTAWLLTKPIIVPTDAKLEFESFNSLHYLADSKTARLSVEVIPRDEPAQELITAEQIQAADQKFKFTWLEADLAEYAGQEIQLKFTATTGVAAIIAEYEVGWYLDNIHIGTIQPPAEITTAELQPQTQNITTAGTNNSTPATVIPASGVKVVLGGVERSQQVHAGSGTWQTKVSPGTWQVTASLYGYIPVTETINVPATATSQQVHITLIPAPKITINATITTPEGTPIPGAGIRIVGDDFVTPVTTDHNGQATLSNVITGPGTEQHRVRAYAPGFLPAEASLSENLTFQLVPREQQLLEEQKFDNNQPETNIVLARGGRGAAVQFETSKQQAVLDKISFYTVRMTADSTPQVMVGVYEEDAHGRLQTLAVVPATAKADSWNEVQLAGYNIRPARKFFVAVIQQQNGPNAYGVAVDNQTGSNKATANTYLFDGYRFVPAILGNITGAAMIRAHLWYPAAAPDHPDPASKPDVPDTPAGAFTTAEQDGKVWITGYQVDPDQLHVKIPAQIDGKPVVGIRSKAFNWKGINSLVIPEGVTTIETDAFTGAFRSNAVDAEGNRITPQLHIPSTVTSLPENTVTGLNHGRITGLAGVTELATQTFVNVNDTEIIAPAITRIAATAFTGKHLFYNRLTTGAGNPHRLQSIDGQVLINPVRINALTKVLDTDLIEQTVIVGSHPDLGRSGTEAEWPTTIAADQYFQAGKQITLAPPRNALVSYLDETPQQLVAADQLQVSFPAVSLTPILGPLFAGDTEVTVGANPGFQVTIAQAGYTAQDQWQQNGTIAANGQVQLAVPQLITGTVKVTVSDQRGKSLTKTVTVADRPDADWASSNRPDGTAMLTRYLAQEEAPVVPAQLGTQKVTAIGPYAAAGKQIEQLAELEENNELTSLGRGAFQNNQLTQFKLPAGVKDLAPYLLADNQLSELHLNRTTNRVGAYAVANNALSSVDLGQFMSRIDEGAFSNNRLSQVSIPPRVTSLGAKAFASNRLTSVAFARSGVELFADDAIPQVLTELPARVFADNQLTQVNLPPTINQLAADAFADNGRLVNIVSTNKQLQDAILADGSGHIINGASIRVVFADSKGGVIKPAENWVAQGIQERFDRQAQYYRVDQPVTVVAPEIPGYTVSPKQVTVTPQAFETMAVLFRYTPQSDTTAVVAGDQPAAKQPKSEPSKVNEQPKAKPSEVNEQPKVVEETKPKESVVQDQPPAAGIPQPEADSKWQWWWLVLGLLGLLGMGVGGAVLAGLVPGVKLPSA